MTKQRPTAEHTERTPPVFDPESAAWLDELRAGGAVREGALARLHGLLLGVARAEAFRRRSSLPDTVIAELDALCMQAANDALRAITDKLDAFRGDSRFTTWAYKFAILEISMRLRRSAWHERRIVLNDAAWERLSDPAADAQQRLVQQELVAALRSAVTNALTRRQREVFLAVAVEEVPIDVLAERMGTSRGAVYKVLHDARQKLRRILAKAGHGVGEA
jgi:RNA polymerase sigma-70 factor, ECF subfamily